MNKKVEVKKVEKKVVTKVDNEKALTPIFEAYAKNNGLKCEYIDKDGGLFRIATDMNAAPKQRIDIKVTSKGVTVWCGLDMNVVGLVDGVNGSHISNREKRYTLTIENAKKVFTVTAKKKPATQKKDTAKKAVNEN